MTDEGPPANFTAGFDQRTVPDPDATALIQAETGVQVTHEAFRNRVAAAANVFRAHGLGEGDRIALFFPNELTYLYCFFGAMRIGAVPVPVNIKVPDSTIEFIVADSTASMVVTSADPRGYEPAVHGVTANVDQIETVFVAGSEATPADFGGVETTALAPAMAEAPRRVDAASVAPEDPAMQAYTSGSTGRPKGVVLTHRGVAWNTEAVGDAWLLDADERGNAATPLYHKNVMPQVKALLQRGGSVVVMDGFEVESLLAGIETYDITFITGVPAMYKMLLNEETLLEAYDTSSLRFAIAGSAPVSPELYNRFVEAFKTPLLEAYGLTEGGPVVSVSPRWGVTKVGATGPALPGCDTMVVDVDTGEPVEPGTVGELLVSNPGLGTYFNRPEANETAFEQRDGRTYLHTDDLATVDEDGYHSIVGRVDNMMIVGGENVYPTAVEDLLLGHPAITDVAVVPVAHDIKGEAPVAFVTTTDETLTEATIKEYALGQGPAYAHPRRVLFVDELPRTGTEKIDRIALTDRAEAEIGMIERT